MLLFHTVRINYSYLYYSLFLTIFSSTPYDLVSSLIISIHFNVLFYETNGNIESSKFSRIKLSETILNMNPVNSYMHIGIVKLFWTSLGNNKVKIY